MTVTLNPMSIVFPFDVSAAPFGSFTDFNAFFVNHPGLMAWHQPTAAACMPDGSNFVSTYTPTGGTGNWTQPTSGKQPLFVPSYSSLSGNPCLYLNRAHPDFMIWGGTFPTGAGSKFTKIALVQPDAAMAGTPGHLLSFQAASANRHISFLGGQFQTGEIAVSNGALVANTTETLPYDGSWYLQITGFNGAPGGSSNTVFIQVNHDGGKTVTGAGVPGSAQLCLGASDLTGSTNTFLGHYADDWIYNHAIQSDADMADVISMTLAYCLARYGLSLP